MDEAENGQAGLERARQDRPDLILCDLDMPVMDGFETLICLRDDPALRRVPVIGVACKHGDHRAFGQIDASITCRGYVRSCRDHDLISGRTPIDAITALVEASALPVNANQPANVHGIAGRKNLDAGRTIASRKQFKRAVGAQNERNS